MPILERAVGPATARSHYSDRSENRSHTDADYWLAVVGTRSPRSEGARGLIADLSVAGMLTRQAAYVVVANVDLDAPGDFLRRLDVQAGGAEGIGLALRTYRAREIIAAVFAIYAENVPNGYLRALAKIEEVGSNAPGMNAFERQESYRSLFDILTAERDGRRAHALRYSSKLRSSTIDAVTHLDPMLVHPEIVGVVGTPQRVAAANAMLALIRECHSTVAEETLVTAIKQSAASLGSLEAFARKALDTADRLPTPIPEAEDVRPLRTAADYREIGTKLRNCAPTKIAEVALGLLVVVEVTHRADDGTETILAASLTPLADGRWLVSEVGGTKNRRPSKAVLADVLRRLQALGAVIPGPQLGGGYRKDLADLLGIYRWAPLDDALHPHGGDENEEEDAVAELTADIDEAA